jgi:hypothetical protein
MGLNGPRQWNVLGSQHGESHGSYMVSRYTRVPLLPIIVLTWVPPLFWLWKPPARRRGFDVVPEAAQEISRASAPPPPDPA